MNNIASWVRDWPGKHGYILEFVMEKAEKLAYISGVFCRVTVGMVLIGAVIGTVMAVLCLLLYLLGLDGID